MTLNRIFYIMLLSAVAMAIFSLYAWMQLPDDALVAIHWNAEGDIDNYVSKTLGLFSTPLITLALAGLMKALPYQEPRRKNLENSGKLIGATFIGILLVLGVAHYTIVATALGWAVHMFFMLKIALGAMLILIGNYAGKSKSMFLVGFRTPWTLSSETVWKKTHSLFGKLFMLSGLILIALPLSVIAGKTFAYFFITLIISPVLICLVYSWVIWKKEQD